jgi:anti-anti-sigma factor
MVSPMDDPRPFTIRLERSSVGSAVWATGRLGIEAAGELRAAIIEASRHQPRVVLELSEVDSIDAAALGAVVAARRHAGDATAIVLRNPNALVAKLLHLTELDDSFEIEPRAVAPGRGGSVAGGQHREQVSAGVDDGGLPEEAAGVVDGGAAEREEGTEGA